MTHNSRPRIYSEDYFSLKDVLATQERLPCKINIQVLNMGNF